MPRLSKSKQLIVISGALIAVCLCLLALYRSTNTSPSIRVSLRMVEPATTPLSCRWIVENNSDTDITFDAGDIRAVDIDGKPVDTPDGAKGVVLSPQEKFEERFVLPQLPAGHHKFTVTASCNEGTSAAMSVRVKVPY